LAVLRLVIQFSKILNFPPKVNPNVLGKKTPTIVGAFSARPRRREDAQPREIVPDAPITVVTTQRSLPSKLGITDAK
jgi:hypothetical protein